MPPSQKRIDPQKKRAFGPSRYSSNAAISSGRPLRPSGDLNAVDERADGRVVATLLQERRLDRAGRDRVERDAGARPLRRRCVAPHPPAERGLRDRVGAERLALTGERACRLFVAVEATGDEILVETGLARGGVRADGDGRGIGAVRQQRSQPREQLDGAEVVHRDQQRRRTLGKTGEPRQRDQTVERTTRQLGRPARWRRPGPRVSRGRPRRRRCGGRRR